MLTTPSQPMRSRSSNPFLFINGLISVGWAKYELVNPTRAFKGMPVADGRHTPVSKSSFPRESHSGSFFADQRRGAYRVMKVTNTNPLFLRTLQVSSTARSRLFT